MESVCVSKLPQLSGHVEGCSTAFHEKLKPCPDLMEEMDEATLGRGYSAIVHQADDKLHVFLTLGINGEC